MSCVRTLVCPIVIQQEGLTCCNRGSKGKSVLREVRAGLSHRVSSGLLRRFFCLDGRREGLGIFELGQTSASGGSFWVLLVETSEMGKVAR